MRPASSASTLSFSSGKVVRADPQRRELRLRHHFLQAHQRLILLDDLPLLHQDLLDHASLEMLHGANLRDRDELAARERELADRSRLRPTATHRQPPRQAAASSVRETRKPLCSSNSIGVVSQSGVSDRRAALGLSDVRFMTSSRRARDLLQNLRNDSLGLAVCDEPCRRASR